MAKHSAPGGGATCRLPRMQKPKLTYFDAPVSRGEECRIALHLAGVAFDDHRIKHADWAAMKAHTPFGALPVFEAPGHAPLGQSNAILGLVGRLHGLHPTEPYEAARHEAMMAHVEDLRAAVSPTMRLKTEDEKQRARAQLVAGFLPEWGAFTERQMGDGPFFAGDAIQVVDIKLYVVVRWFKNGALDHIPASIFDALPKLMRLFGAVHDHAGVAAWRAKH